MKANIKSLPDMEFEPGSSSAVDIHANHPSTEVAVVTHSLHVNYI